MPYNDYVKGPRGPSFDERIGNVLELRELENKIEEIPEPRKSLERVIFHIEKWNSFNGGTGMILKQLKKISETLGGGR